MPLCRMTRRALSHPIAFRVFESIESMEPELCQECRVAGSLRRCSSAYSGPLGAVPLPPWLPAMKIGQVSSRLPYVGVCAFSYRPLSDRGLSHFEEAATYLTLTPCHGLHWSSSGPKGLLSSRVSGVAGSKTLSRSCPADGSEDIPACNNVNESSGMTPCLKACLLQTHGPAILCAESRCISTAQSKRAEEQIGSNILRPRSRRAESVSVASTPAANGQIGQTQSLKGD